MDDSKDDTTAAAASETADDASAVVDETPVVEDASDNEQEEAAAPVAAAPHQFNFNLPAANNAAAAAAAVPPPPPHLDFANLNLANPDEINRHFLSLLPPSIHPRITKLKSLNEDRAKLLEEYLVERSKLESKYNDLMKPLYEKRRDVVMGALDEEIAANNNNDGDGNNNDDTVVKGIPQFWACAMGHIDIIAELITEQDIDCLDHLIDITCTDFTNGSGFELHFHFNTETNPFFTNSVLTKRYEVPNLLTDDEPMLQSVTGTEIDWTSDERCLTHRIVTKKQRKKGGPNAGQVRTVSKKEKADSFFHFFIPPKMPEVRLRTRTTIFYLQSSSLIIIFLTISSNETNCFFFLDRMSLQLGDIVDEEDADAMEDHFDHDYEIACIIRGSLIPNAVEWFTGEALEDLYGDEDGLDDIVEDEEGLVGVNEGFVFNPDGGGAGGANNNPFPPPAPGNGENPECQQN